MTSLNKIKKQKPLNNAGMPGGTYSAEVSLERLVMTSMLWEDNFYIDGITQAQYMALACRNASVEEIARVAIETRESGKIRHAPLILCMALLGKSPAYANPRFIGESIAKCLKRPDEITELTNMWLMSRDLSPGKPQKKMPRQLRLAINTAFNSFDEYQLAKYNRPGAVTLKDALFLSHAKGKNAKQQDIFNRLVSDNLKTPNTWETKLSSGAGKKESFDELLNDGKLGLMAILRNLRNMQESGADLNKAASEIKRLSPNSNVLPFRYLAAANHCPTMIHSLDEGMQAACANKEKLTGKNLVLVDVSVSMDWSLSVKSEMNRMDAACTLAAYIEMLSEIDGYECMTFSNSIKDVPMRYRGIAQINQIKNNMPHGGTELHGAIAVARRKKYDRLIVITDEQATDSSYRNDSKSKPKTDKEYVINVAPYQVGVENKAGLHLINGFSERVIDYVIKHENLRAI